MNLQVRNLRVLLVMGQREDAVRLEILANECFRKISVSDTVPVDAKL